MKKAIAALLAVSLSAALMLSLTACGGPETEASAYGLVHKYYVAQVRVVKRGNRLQAVIFEETEGPSSWAKKSNIKEDKIDGVEFTTGGFAKKISIGALTFTATDDAGTKTPAYRQTDGGETFEEWVKREENAKFYVETMANGDYKLLKADGSAADLDFSKEKNNLKKGERWLKSKNGYWSGENMLGWQGNMNNLSDYIIRNGVEDYVGSEIKDGDSWVIDGVDTGATLVDFHDYMSLAKRAYERIM